MAIYKFETDDKILFALSNVTSFSSRSLAILKQVGVRYSAQYTQLYRDTV